MLSEEKTRMSFAISKKNKKELEKLMALEILETQKRVTISEMILRALQKEYNLTK